MVMLLMSCMVEVQNPLCRKQLMNLKHTFLPIFYADMYWYTNRPVMARQDACHLRC